jgi:hypothetical protein
MLQPANNDLNQIFHNVQLHPIPRCCPEFLLTRFAWSIFPLLTGFLCRCVPRYVVIVDEKGNRTAREVSDTKQLQDRVAKSRSRSPKNRMRATEPGDDELADNDGLASCDGSASPQSSASKHSSDENQSPKRKSYSSSSLEVPASHPHLTKNGFEWYPGSNRFDILRKQALALQRPSNFHNEKKKRKMSLREELEDMGFEILDDFDGRQSHFKTPMGIHNPLPSSMACKFYRPLSTMY